MSQNLSKHEALLVRACKSRKPTAVKLSKTTGIIVCMDACHVHPFDVCHWLFEVVNKFQLIKVNSLLLDVLPKYFDKHYNFLYPVENIKYHEALMCALTSIIRLTEVSKLPGYIRPCRFRNKSNS